MGELMNRTVIFWLGPNETKVRADQIPGAIAEWAYPLPHLNFNRLRPDIMGQSPPDIDAAKRLIEEREQAKHLRIKFPRLNSNSMFSIKKLNAYFDRIGLVAEIRYRPSPYGPIEQMNTSV